MVLLKTLWMGLALFCSPILLAQSPLADHSSSARRPLPGLPFPLAETTPLQIQPNPATDRITVRYQTPATPEQLEARLYNVLGVELAQASLQFSQPGTYVCRFPVSHLTDGVYVVQVKEDEKVWVRKFVKNH